MWSRTSGAYHIWWLDRSASPKAWVDTGTPVDTRAASRADTLWDGTHLYIASALSSLEERKGADQQTAEAERTASWWRSVFKRF